MKEQTSARRAVKILTTLLIAMAWLLATTLQGAESNPREPLRLRLGLGSAPAPALPNSVLWLAKDLDFYKREGLDVDLKEFQGTPLAIAAMIAGEVDVANVSTSDVIRMVATKNQPMRAIHSPMPGSTFSSPPEMKSNQSPRCRAKPLRSRASAASTTLYRCSLSRLWGSIPRRSPLSPSAPLRSAHRRWRRAASMPRRFRLAPG